MNNSPEEQTGSQAIIALIAKHIVAQLASQPHAPTAPPDNDSETSEDQNGDASTPKQGT